MSNNAVHGIVESDESEAIMMIMRQTDYTKEIAEMKLLEHKGNVVSVIREYINPTGKTGLVSSKKLSTNQRVYKEIRGLMDDAARTYELNKQKS